ncbi:MAG TPA: TetR/AcrR family transcriptional regulator [Geothrix sp.]|nr:TetR/AcrR family transcriptional regulator [Geothrix sp.]
MIDPATPRSEPAHPSKLRLLDAALKVIRTKGYAATRLEDVCAEAGVTKGSFFHHFSGKEDLAVAAAEHWSTTTGTVFRQAPYQLHADPLARLLAYVDFRKALLRGEPAEYTCLAGTLVQETFETSPAIREACDGAISGHAAEVARDIAEAKARYAPDAAWTAEGLALHTQAVIQGAFILAKARHDARVAADSLDHLRRYLELLFNPPKEETCRHPAEPSSGTN